MQTLFSRTSRFANVTAAVALLFAGMLMADEPIPRIDTGQITPFRAEYSVGNNLINAGSAILSLKDDEGLWLYSLRTRPEGVFKLTGKGRIQETAVIEIGGQGVGIHPLRYSYRQDDEKKRNVNATFDWKNRQMSWNTRDESGKESMADTPIFDRLSVTLLAMNALRGDGFDQVEFEVFDNGRVKTVQFVNEGKESVDTAQGEVESIKVRSFNVDSGRRQTLTWFAPSLDYVPVKIEQLKRGDLVARLTLTDLKNRAREIKAEE